MERPQRIVFVQGGPAPARDVSVNRAATLARSLGVPLTRTDHVALPGFNGSGGGEPRPWEAVVVVESDAVPGPAGRAPGARARSFVRSTPCPVWLLAPQGPPRSRVIVAAVSLRTPDPGPLDQAVVAMADALARAEGARLLVVHGWSLIGESIVSCPVRGLGMPRARRVLARLRDERQARLDALLLSVSPATATRWILAKGNPAQTVRDVMARTGAQALVMGYEGRTGAWGMIRGNLAEDFLTLPGVSLMAVRPPAWPDPGLTPSGSN